MTRINDHKREEEKRKKRAREHDLDRDVTDSFPIPENGMFSYLKESLHETGLRLIFECFYCFYCKWKKQEKTGMKDL